jgi:hypothetical protein
MLEFYKKKKPSDKGYDTSFARNFHERTDMPVFSVVDAVTQIKKPDPNKSETEISMDEWFINNLPMSILNSDIDMDSREDGIVGSQRDARDKSLGNPATLHGRSAAKLRGEFGKTIKLAGTPGS